MVLLVSFVFMCIRCEHFLYTNICAHNNRRLQTAPGLGSYNAEFAKEIQEDADQVFQSAR